jgi:hypothetical protein
MYMICTYPILYYTICTQWRGRHALTLKAAGVSAHHTLGKRVVPVAYTTTRTQEKAQASWPRALPLITTHPSKESLCPWTMYGRMCAEEREGTVRVWIDVRVPYVSRQIVNLPNT